MAAPGEISLEAVRDFMLDRGGRVTNQDLVRHFKHVLTDPYTKGKRRVGTLCLTWYCFFSCSVMEELGNASSFGESVKETLAFCHTQEWCQRVCHSGQLARAVWAAWHLPAATGTTCRGPGAVSRARARSPCSLGARQGCSVSNPLPVRADHTRTQFKEYVNQLAAIRQENGEKHLMLKSRFYPPGMVPLYSTNDWDAGLASGPPAHQRQPPPAEAPAFRAPPPYRPPPEPVHLGQQRRSSFAGSEGSFTSTHSGPPSYHHPPPVQPSPPPPPPQQQRFTRQLSVPCDDFIPASVYLRDAPPERAVSIQDLTSNGRSAGSTRDLTGAPALPPRRKPQRQDDKENMVSIVAFPRVTAVFHNDLFHQTASLGSLDKQDGANSEEAKISVKERTQRFNKMASEVDLLSSQAPVASKSGTPTFPSRSKVLFKNSLSNFDYFKIFFSIFYNLFTEPERR